MVAPMKAWSARGLATTLVLAGCGGGTSNASGSGNETETDALDTEASPSDTSDADTGESSGGVPDEPDCDLQAVFAKPDNGCTNAGCHGVQHVAGLDLASDGLGERLVGRGSSTAACGERLIIDPADIDASLLLTQITPEGVAGGCGVIMPLGSQGVSADDYSCIEAWAQHFSETEDPEEEEDFCDAFEPSSPRVYVSKVKTLLTGRRATAAEVAAVEADPDALRGLAQSWIETPEFSARLLPFLRDTLQFTDDLADLDNRIGAVAAYQPYLESNLGESFARTMLRIIDEDRPFTEIATTTSWEVTTFTLAILSYLDASEDERRVDHQQVVTPGGGVPNPIPLQYSIDNAIWQLAPSNAQCEGLTRRGAGVLTMLLGRCQGSMQSPDPIFEDADFNDWRTVELTAAASDEPEPVFWDVLSLRAAQSSLPVGMPRVGFLTHPAFLAQWETNEDNQFRVTTNQALLVMTGHTFEVGDTTEPLGTDGLDPAHAEPGSACHACHRALDPMRVFYQNAFDYDYLSRGAEHGTLTPGYAFRGEAALAEDLYDLADILATNPDFAAAWTQKLCHWANSQACDEQDPEFIRVAEVFEDSGFSFQTLVVELMTSPLVTGSAFTETYCSREFVVSITRRDQLCQSLETRLGVAGVCDDGRLSKLVELIPEDALTRGSPVPIQNPTSSAFHAAGVERFCIELAEEFVIPSSAYVGDVADGVALIASGMMGIDPEASRSAEVRAVLTEHVTQATASSDSLTAMRSAFALGCMSSDVQALGL